MELKPFTHSVIRFSNMLTVPILLISVALWIVVVYLFVRRQMCHQKPEAWSHIKTPLIVAMLPLLLLWNYWGEGLLSANKTIVYSLKYTALIAIISVVLLCAGLWYKGILALKYIRTYILAFLIGFACFATLETIFIYGTQFLLRTDPAWVNVEEHFTQMEQERKLE